MFDLQWRHFGAESADSDANDADNGVEPLREFIRKIKQDPTRPHHPQRVEPQ